MKKIILFLSLFTIVYLFECRKYMQIMHIMPSITSNDCQIRKMFGKIKLSVIDYTNNKKDLIPFNLELKNINNINISCYIKEENISFYSFSIRNAYCYILSDLLNDLSNYNIASIYSKYDDIKIIDNFKLNDFNKYEYSNYNMSIFYRQVNNFTLQGKNGTFMFYGLTKSTSSYSSQITLLVNINNKEIRESKCNEQYVENISLYIRQITYKCEIKEIDNISNLRILDSDDVSGIPYDYNDILRDPIETQNAIKAGTLVNYAESKSISLFNIHYIYSNDRRGILTFIGTIFGEIKENKIFPILISSSDKCQSECYVPASTSGEEIQIKCILCSTISQKSNFIFEHQILKNGNDEILFFNEFKTEKYIASKMNDVTIINGILGNYSENIFNTALIESSKYNKLNEFIINGIFDGIINIKINLINKRLFLLDYSLNCSLINNSEGKAEIYCGTGNKFYQKIKCVDENVIIEYDNEDNKKENENIESEMGLIEKEINETDIEKSDEIANNESQKYGSDINMSDYNNNENNITDIKKNDYNIDLNKISNENISDINSN